MAELSNKDPLEPVIGAVESFYARKDLAHDLNHALRVRDWARKLADEEGANCEIVELAALLHDIGRTGVEKSHAESSAGLAVSVLTKLGYKQTVIEEVRAAVISHSRESGYEPSTLEAKILYDADKLDFVGPVGIARLFSWGGAAGWKMIGENSCKEFYEQRIRHYEEHLFTAAGKTCFKPLLEYMEKFWGDLALQIR